MKIIEPVVLEPLRREWDGLKEQIRELDARREKANSPAAREKLVEEARALYRGFRERLGAYRVLDPACGSGNFLALSLRHLKDFDAAVLDDAKALGLPPDDFRVGPEAVKGIEINAYAAELARLTVWITELQWQLQKGVGLTRRPILDRLDGIQRGDALLTPSGRDADWPEADVVVGNPPFLGRTFLRRSLGDAYVDRLFAAFSGRVPADADLVCYWFEKALERLRDGRLERAGLVATNSIRGGANRRVLDRIGNEGQIFDAWDDEPWVIKGVAVRVSLVCFAINDNHVEPRLDGEPVERIASNLSGSNVDLTVARALAENRGVCFEGWKKYGPFDIRGDIARDWLRRPLNPNSEPNARVLRQWLNAMDIARRSGDRWVVDFYGLSIEEAALFEVPFAHVEKQVRPAREKDRNEATRNRWWLFERNRPELRQALIGLRRYIATPVVAKHRLFVWLAPNVLSANLLDVIARDDDAAFGILHSRFHETWSIGLCTWLGVGNDPRYTPSTTFETFPFPEGLTPNIPATQYENDPRAIAIAAAAHELDRLRNAWLNPPDLIRIEPEVVPGYPDRILPKDAAAEKTLKTRTLTNLYNERPAWLANAHRDLDAAVAAAYGWPADIAEEDALARLLALNLERAAAGR